MSTKTEVIAPDDLAEVRARVEAALDEIRPFLQADHGDISLEEVSPEGVVRVRLHGACRDCTMVAMTMKAGVEQAIKKACPEVVEVVNE